MEIRTTRAMQAEVTRVTCTRCVLRWLMTACHHFQGAPARIAKLAKETPQRLVGESITSGMGNDRNTTAAGNPAHGMFQMRPVVWHISGFAATQIKLESAVGIACVTGTDQMPSEVRTTDHSRIGS